MSRAALPRTVSFLTAFLGLSTAVSGTGSAALPGPLLPGSRVPTPEEAEIEQQPICVGSTVRSAGALGDALFYRHERLPDGRLAIGYYAFYSDERPWGNNWLTWLLLPALAIDVVYSRALLIAPGLQRAAYGKGDVEGFRVIYEVDEASHLKAVEAFADDGYHRPERLKRADLFSIDPAKLTVYTDTWNHHLGAKGSTSGDLVSRRCYGPGSIRPLTQAVAREFHLERRALPAAVGSIAPDRPLSGAGATRSDAYDAAPF